MATAQSSHKSGTSPWLLSTALAVMLLANLALIVYLSVDAWHTSESSHGDAAKFFNEHKDRIDNLNRLVTALIGLSTLYTVVLGTTVYLSAQSYVDRIKEQQTELKDKADELKRKFPAFDKIDAAVDEIVRSLKASLPDNEDFSKNLDELIGLEETVMSFERSAALFEFLDPNEFKDGSEVLRRLSRFYRGLYEREKIEVKDAAKVSKEAKRYLQRARIYAERAAKKYPNDFTVKNEMASVLQEVYRDNYSDRVREQYQESVKSASKQQRANFWLGMFAMNDEKYEEAEKRFTLALKSKNWEIERASEEQTLKLYYNRACARSRLAEATNDKDIEARFANEALADLELSFPAGGGGLVSDLKPDLGLKEPDIKDPNNAEDLKKQDLRWLYVNRPDAVEKLLTRLNLKTS